MLPYEPPDLVGQFLAVGFNPKGLPVACKRLFVLMPGMIYIAEMLGHQKLETTMGYTRVSMAKLHEVHARCHPAEQSVRGSGV